MNKLIEWFEKLVKENGSNVVFKDGEEYCFGMGNGVLDMDEDELDEYKRIEEEVENVKGIKWYLGYGDDVINCVGVKDLELIEKVEGLKEFIEKYV